jgi:Spy/CpxP family protein refolding chaperone
MVRHFSCALGVAVLLSATPVVADCQQPDKRPPATAPQASRPRFWQDPKLRQEFAITEQQSVLIEQIFSTSIPSLREARKELDALEAVLSRTIQENIADLMTVSQQVDKVEAARSTFNKARTIMLYRINLVLSPEQRVKVKAFNERYDEQRRKDEEARRKESKRD